MDINSDLGEGEPLTRTRALMRRITSANIACGGHAGDVSSMKACLRLCRQFGVHPGAHPGFADRANFGRRPHPLTPARLRALLGPQIAALAELADAPLSHVKLHGALYHVVEQDAALALAFVRFLAESWPGLRIIALAEGRVVRAARRHGVPAWGEIFAERGYQDDGRLVPRGRPGALVEDLRIVRARARHFARTGEILTVSGASRPVEAATICVHSDSPGSVRIAGVLARVFRA
jgi:5-oxoprolinase (ATP-hydrolysing) subunit A